jgi:hypothetical protein
MTKPHLFIFQDEYKNWHGIKENKNNRASLYKPYINIYGTITWKHDFYATFIQAYDILETAYAFLDYYPSIHDHDIMFSIQTKCPSQLSTEELTWRTLYKVP